MTGPNEELNERNRTALTLTFARLSPDSTSNEFWNAVFVVVCRWTIFAISHMIRYVVFGALCYCCCCFILREKLFQAFTKNTLIKCAQMECGHDGIHEKLDYYEQTSNGGRNETDIRMGLHFGANVINNKTALASKNFWMRHTGFWLGPLSIRHTVTFEQAAAKKTMQLKRFSSFLFCICMHFIPVQNFLFANCNFLLKTNSIV